MAVLHFLNVKEGDCHIVKHASGRVSIIDCNNTKIESEDEKRAGFIKELARLKIKGNFNQKTYPVNPIEYMKKFGYSSVFRFILTHPEMDHMGGIKDFFAEFSPTNFWDTENTEEKDFDDKSLYNEDDWLFYKSLRDNKPNGNPKRLTNYVGDTGKYWSEEEDGKKPGDALTILAPTKELVDHANECEDFHCCSYVILYRAFGGKVLFCGDSHDKTWEYILENHKEVVKNVKILIAPHHGRDSDRSYEFLKVVNPTLTLMGNAPSDNLAYDKYNKYGMGIIINNQANCVIVEVGEDPMKLYVTNQSFAEKLNSSTYYSDYYQGWYCLDF
jgi:beta-lactamase superfamily II metal-dependent hydrolase